MNESIFIPEQGTQQRQTRRVGCRTEAMKSTSSFYFHFLVLCISVCRHMFKNFSYSITIQISTSVASQQFLHSPLLSEPPLLHPFRRKISLMSIKPPFPLLPKLHRPPKTQNKHCFNSFPMILLQGPKHMRISFIVLRLVAVLLMPDTSIRVLSRWDWMENYSFRIPSSMSMVKQVIWFLPVECLTKCLRETLFLGLV